MKKVLLIIPAFILLTATATQVTFVTNVQAYSASDYNPQYTPYNFEEADDANLCRDEIRAFDSDYDALSKSYTDNLTEVILISGVQGSLNNVTAWLEASEFYYSTEFKDCIADNAYAEKVEAKADAREELVRMGLVACDLEVIEDLTEAEELRFEDKLKPCVDARTAEIEAAVAICDFDFFDNEMTRKERNSWFVERTGCEDNPPKVTPKEIEVVSVYVPEPVVFEPIVAQYVPPAKPVIQQSDEDTAEDESEDMVEEVSTTTIDMTTEEVIKVTQEELDRMVEEKLNEKLNEIQIEPDPVPESKPPFLKRVTNFLFGWMF